MKRTTPFSIQRGMRIGVARVSTRDRNPEAQGDVHRAAHCGRVRRRPTHLPTRAARNTAMMEALADLPHRDRRPHRHPPRHRHPMGPLRRRQLGRLPKGCRTKSGGPQRNAFARTQGAAMRAPRPVLRWVPQLRLPVEIGFACPSVQAMGRRRPQRRRTCRGAASRPCPVRARRW